MKFHLTRCIFNMMSSRGTYVRTVSTCDSDSGGAFARLMLAVLLHHCFFEKHKYLKARKKKGLSEACMSHFPHQLHNPAEHFTTLEQ